MDFSGDYGSNARRLKMWEDAIILSSFIAGGWAIMAFAVLLVI